MKYMKLGVLGNNEGFLVLETTEDYTEVIHNLGSLGAGRGGVPRG